MIINPEKKQKIKWYRCGHIEGKYIARIFGFSPIHVDNKFYYYVETDNFKKIINKIPVYIRVLSKIKNAKQKSLVWVRNLRKKR